MNTDILIIGAGPAGIFAALELLRNGYKGRITMVEKGKPEPDIYLYAAEKLGVTPRECMVLEDSPAGILAAHRAGCVPVMIPDQDEPDAETERLLYACVARLDLVPDLLS